MWLFYLAWKNLWRNKHRTVITTSAIFFSVILSILASSLKTGIFNHLVKNMVSFYTGYIQLHKKGYWKEQNLENSFILHAGLGTTLSGTQNVQNYTYRLESFALASTGEITKGCIAVGIQPESENAITSLASKIKKGKYIKGSDQSVLLAQGLAQQLKLDVGDTLLLIGQGYHGSLAAGKYPVSGILELGAPDLNTRLMYMPLALAYEFYDANNRATSCVVMIHDVKNLDQTATALRTLENQGFEVMNWKEMMPDIHQHIQTDTQNMKVVTAILYLLIAFGIFGTILMMTQERQFEMGMLIAVGMQKHLLICCLIIESFFIIVLGCFTGILVSIPLIFYLSRHPLRMVGELARSYERFGFEAVFPTATDANIFIAQASIVLSIGLFLSMYFVFKVIRLIPVKAMRR